MKCSTRKHTLTDQCNSSLCSSASRHVKDAGDAFDCLSVLL